MGMPCQVNSILKLARSQGYPDRLQLDQSYTVTKSGYRIFPLDVPLALVDETWHAHADIRIDRLTWEQQATAIDFTIVRLYDTPWSLK
jgi:Protein of unknown function (DUF2584)